MTRRVEVTPYQPGWVEQARQEAERIAAVFADRVVAVHHIGSTSVPGLPAKPTLDFLIEVDDINRVDAMNPGMQGLGYQPKGENGIPGRRYFQKLDGETHTYHVHVFQRSHQQIMILLDFRDYLIAHPDAACAYAALKQELARRYPEDALAYTNGKSDFIQSINRKARAWRQEHP